MIGKFSKVEWIGFILINILGQGTCFAHINQNE